MLAPSFPECSPSGWPRIFIKVMTFFGFVVLLILCCFFSTSGFGLMISGMLVISALSIYFDSLWGLFLDMIYCCSKLNLFPVIIVTKLCLLMHWWQHDGNIR